jgi:AdoMet dependent proline di-methyltransferase
MLAEHAHTFPLRGIMATLHLAEQCYGQQLKAAAAGQLRVALDCGSGVGRIAEQLLLQHFQEVGNPPRPTLSRDVAARSRFADFNSAAQQLLRSVLSPTPRATGGPHRAIRTLAFASQNQPDRARSQVRTFLCVAEHHVHLYSWCVGCSACCADKQRSEVSWSCRALQEVPSTAQSSELLRDGIAGLHARAAAVRACAAGVIQQRQATPTWHSGIMMQTMRNLQCRYDVFWVQWCLMYLTDGGALVRLAFAQMPCCDDTSDNFPVAR